MDLDWFKPRGYRHFDAPVGESFARKCFDPAFVAAHSWSPHIHYEKTEKRYKEKDGKTLYKKRPIMFASHRDACILAKYASDLGATLEAHYTRCRLDDCVIAYRRLGRANYDFAADVFRFVQSLGPCAVLCFDVSKFFDTLDHAILKARLKRLLGVPELPAHWYSVFRQVTKYRRVERADLEKHPVFGPRMGEDAREPIATMAEVVAAGIPITANPDKFGIPQGTPISSAFSNLYMVDVDAVMSAACASAGGIYRRYSDDILIACPPAREAEFEALLKTQVAAHRLAINDDKTERATFGANDRAVFQYLGFNISAEGALIRPSSLARQWRKAKRAIRTTQKHGLEAKAAKKADKTFTKRLRRRFAPVGARNFSKYARRAGDAFGSRRIVRQALRLEGMVDRAIREFDQDG